VLLLLIGLVVGKGMIATASAILMRFPPRGAWLAGVGLAQFGEFGFVLSRLALEHDVVEPTDVEPLLTAGIISMFLTPLLLRTAPNIRAGERILAPLARLMRAKGIEEAEEMRASLSGHVVLIGYGVGGKLVTRSLRNVGAPHVILELNAENVRSGREAGDPVFYADATSAEALGHANAAQARCIVIMINDTAATYRVLEVVRRVAPGVAVVVRTHYLSEQEGVFALGAKRVISQEVEGGIEILAHVLRELEVPGNLIEDEVTAARESTRESARALRVPQNQWTHSPALAALKVETVAIADGSVGASHTLRELDLQARTGALVVAIQRGDDSLFHPRADDVLVPRDVAYLIGEAGAVRAATELLLATSAVDDDPPPPSGSSG
jgi:CPA2 family monovalent cation:H+ antiporter-2